MNVAAPSRNRAPVADRKAREFLRKADPVLGRIIDENPAAIAAGAPVAGTIARRGEAARALVGRLGASR